MQEIVSYSEERFRALFEYASDGILVTDAQGVILLANAAAGRLFGYLPNELTGNKVEILLPRRLTEKHIGLRDNFHKAPHARSMGTGRDLYGMKKDGTEFPVEVSLSPFSTNEGSFVIAFIIDITIRKRYETSIKQQKNELEALTLELEKRVKDRTMILEEALQQLERSRQELSTALEKEKDLNDLKSKFVSMASHEFRTPLATILSSLNLVSKYDDLNDTANKHRHIQRIKNSIKHLTDLLNDVLSITSLEEGKIIAVPENFNLQHFTTQLMAELQELAKEGQQIIYNHQGSEHVYLDKKFLRIVFLNLISNAIKFSPDKAVIEVHTAISNAMLDVKVKDNGVGISQEDIEHLFERFFRGNNVTNIQGTGLGLNIVARYLEMMDGSIQVNSKLNQGTTFIITLPHHYHHE